MDDEEVYKLLFEDDSSTDSDEMFGEALMARYMYEMHTTQVPREPIRTSALSGRQYVIELLNGHPSRLYDHIRMDRGTFEALCTQLRTMNILDDDREISLQESLCMFLWTISHNERIRTVAERYQHSLQTVSNHFQKVLNAMCHLAPVIIRPRNYNSIPPQILNNPKYYPWFKDCIGAIDGTHISAVAPGAKSLAFRGRKTTVSQNIMCACSFDMLFTYVYTGWEGTANDSRVLLEALRGNNGFPIPPEGKYYVVDSGYTNMPGFLAPYRGQRYHLRNYRGRGKHPRGAKELFNFRHSSLRNVIERCFGVLKARFPILKLMPSYPFRKQRKIPIACCVIHNFIRLHSMNDSMFNQYDVDAVPLEDIEGNQNQTEGLQENETDGNDEAESSATPELNFSPAYIAQMENVRDNIAGHMWSLYPHQN